MKKKIASLLDKEFLRFCLVGAVNTLVGTAVMFGLYNFAGCSYWVSSAMNYVVGGIVSFFLNKYFTFKAQGRGVRQALRFAANVAVCYFLAYSLAKPFVYGLMSGASVKVQDNVAMLAGMIIYTGLNYLGQRFFAFREAKTQGDAGEE